MKTILLPVLIFILSGWAFAQDPNPLSKRTQTNAVAFYYDVLNFASSDTALTRVDVFLQVPFNKVQFYKADAVFRGEYTAVASIYDENNSVLMQEKSWSEKLEAADFISTRSANNFDLSLKSFKIKPGTYTFRMLIEDKDSKKEYKAEQKITVKSFAKPRTVSDIVILAESPKNPGARMIPDVSRIVSAKDKGMKIYYEIYTDSGGRTNISYSIIDQKKKVRYHLDTWEKLEVGVNKVAFRFDSLDLSTGEFSLRVALVDSTLKVIDASNKLFQSRMPGLSFQLKDLDKAIDEMRYIANPTEIDSIKDAKTYDEKLERFNAYWQKRDPSAATEENELFNEYYRRVDYANENFSHYVDGYKTDMGMVYIILGPPGNVERHPFEYNSKPYEIWEYYELNKKLYFLDNTGFGDYRLITPLSGDLYRYR